ncbi:porin [Dyella silvae]|uniref:porin n=1 Tax=Dyella silvae TaxID=2994424 RepID=UPI00226501BF|nr:porin [Dyella silvae]
MKTFTVFGFRRAWCAVLLGWACVSPAFAETDLPAPKVHFYGLVDVWGGAQKFPGGNSESLISDGGMSTSYWGVGASEQLAEGYKAVVTLEGFFRPTDGAYGRFDGDTFLSRSAYAGIESPYGSLYIGRVTTPLFISTILFNPFVDSYGFSPMIKQTYLGVGSYPSYATDQGVAGDSGWSNALQYQSPEFHGLKGNVTYASGNSSEHHGAKKVAAQLMYAHGAFAATGVYQYINYNGQPGDLGQIVPGWTSQSVAQLGASYDWKVVKLFAQYMHTHNQANQGHWNVNTGQVGVSVPAGKGSVLASYAYSNDSGGMGQTRRTWSLGYDYPFTKYVDAYAAYMNDKISDQSGGYTVGVGLRVKF